MPPFRADDLAFQLILDDQRIKFQVHNTPAPAVEGENKVVLAGGGAVTCGPSNPQGIYNVNYNIGFAGKDDFEQLRDALTKFLEEMRAIKVT